MQKITVFHGLPNRQKQISLPILGIILLLISIYSYPDLTNAQKTLSGNITGRVFQDYNSNGNYDTASGLNSIDTGVAGVTVTAYDSMGAASGSAVTGSNGNFSLAAGGTGPYRLEFTDLPEGYQPSARSTNSLFGGSASNSGSTVQFAADGGTTHVNVALSRFEDYCQNNPEMVISRFAEGAQNGVYGNNSVLMNFPYNAGTTYTDTTVANYDNPSTHSVSVNAGSVGTIFSLAYSRADNRVYGAAYFKRHAGFGPGADGVFNTSDDPGAIYVVNPSTNTVTSTFTVPNATTNSHNTSNYGEDNLDTGWNAVGRSSLGGMALADDESRLFVMNLQNRRLYALNPATGASLGNSAQASSLTLPTPGGTNANCAAGDIRPFAVKYYRGQVYVGIICSAESTQATKDLFAYIFQVDPATLAYADAPLFSFPLDYPRGLADPGQPAEWRAWRSTISSSFAYPQPMFTAMEFENGNLIIGLRDRAGDQAFDNGPDAKRTAGDTLRACGSFGSWTLESNGRCGGAGTAPQGTGQGNGGGEFFHQDDFCLTPNGGNYHDEVSWGVLMYLPGRQHVLTTLLDPIDRKVSSGATFDGGLRWFNNATGSSDRAYRVYNGTGGANVPDFGKANGLGGVTALCRSAPIEIGNRVWLDANGNGVQDPQESRAAASPVTVSGVTVRLYDASGNLLAAAVTDQDGEYYFSSASETNAANAIYNLNLKPNTSYQIRFDNPADYAPGGALNNLFLTLADSAFQAGEADSSDSDAAMVTNPTGSPAGTFAVINLSTGAAGANNHTFDAGFAPAAKLYSLGNRVWTDANNNGRIDAGEQGLANISVSLFADANSDGQPDNPASPMKTMNTDSNGYYRFDGLSAGNYLVGVNPSNFAVSENLYGYQNTAGSDAGNLDTDAMNSENGVDDSNPGNMQAKGILSRTKILGPGVSEPTGEPDMGGGGQGTVDPQANMTVDFGFLLVPTAAQVPVGGRVLTASGRGVAKAVVTLTEESGSTRTVVTNNFGYYRFQGIGAGQAVTVSVFAKRYRFSQPVRAFSLNNAVEDLNFTADKASYK